MIAVSLAMVPVSVAMVAVSVAMVGHRTILCRAYYGDFIDEQILVPADPNIGSILLEPLFGFR